jgi:hypothetical protein
MKTLIGFMSLGIRTKAAYCEDGNESMSFRKDTKFLVYMRGYYCLETDSAPWS